MRWRERSFDKWACYGLLLLILFVFQSAMGDLFAIFGVKPNLLLCAMVALAMQEGEVMGGIFALASGFLTDTFFAPISGYHMLVGVVAGVAVGLLTKLYVNVTPLSTLFMGGGVSLFYNLLFFYTHYFLAGEAGFLKALSQNILPEGLYAAVMMIPFYYLVRFLKNLTTLAEEDEEE